MEAVLLVGLQASGKSSFFIDHFFDTHVRISLDVLKTRHRESKLLEACLLAGQSFVIDNTNPTPDVRAKYIRAARQFHFSVSGYYLQSKLADCLIRNGQRSRKVPSTALYATSAKLRLPSFDEGFDSLHYVRLADQGFLVAEWNDAL